MEETMDTTDSLNRDIEGHLNSQLNAEDLKLNGNELYKQQKYREALEMYSQAISLLPSCAAYYGNRSATYMMLNKYTDALEDARQAVQIDRSFTKGYQREAKCFLALGNSTAAIQSYHRALELEPDNKGLVKELDIAHRVKRLETEAQDDYQKKDFRRVIYCMNQCLVEAPSAIKYKLLKAECLAFLAKYEEASEIANMVIAMDSMNSDAIFVRGLCLYYEDHIEKAQQFFRQVLRLNPDHAKAKETFWKTKSLMQKKEEGNRAFKACQFSEAVSIYTDALEIDSFNKFTNAKLYNNRATANARLGNLQQSVDDCTSAIELDSKYVKAYTRRAKSYSELENYEEAVRDYETLLKLDATRENKQLLQNAKLELKKSQRKDYYKILGISKSASDDEIKKAYRKRAMLHHPDRHSHDTPDKQKEEERIFKDVGEAYSILSDHNKKHRYDTGADLDDGPGFADIDPNNIFQMFFGGGAPDFGGFGGHHPGHRSHHPGGFHFQF